MRLSTKATLFIKVIFPAIWLIGFGLGALVAPFESEKTELQIILPASWFFGLALCAWLCFPLKQVTLLGDALVIRGLWTEDRVPLSNIESVSSCVFTSPETITLKFRNPCVFDSKIRFAPKYRHLQFSPHPTFTMLSKLVPPPVPSK